MIIGFSWYYSLRHGNFHGIPRFFSFESIFLLCLLRWEHWFDNPFSWYQVISWILLITSAYTGIAGFLTLKLKGMAKRNFENTTILVKTGIYSLIRHPLYLSLLCLGSSLMMKKPGPAEIILGIINIGALFITASMEEKEMISKFGNEYKDYMEETRMFLPYLW